MGNFGRKAIAVLLAASASVWAAAPVYAGWTRTQTGQWTFQGENGSLTGWQMLGEKWYYFSADGIMQTGWLKLGDTWYYLDTSGAMKTGWQKIGSQWYFLNGSGAMQTGWMDWNGCRYYFKPDGSMAVGSQTIQGQEYRFDAGGALLESPDSMAQKVLDLVNAHRKEAGLAPLELDAQLNQAAAVRAKESAQNFSHTRPNGQSCFTILDEMQIDYGSAGENIAMNYETPEAVVNGWMNSPGHRANILTAEFSRMGIGCFRDGQGSLCWAQLFTGE